MLIVGAAAVWVLRGRQWIKRLAPGPNYSVLRNRLTLGLQGSVDLLVTHVFLIALNITPFVHFDVDTGVQIVRSTVLQLATTFRQI